MIVDSEAMRVGNRDGLSWMESMERETRVQKIINAQQKQRWFRARATEIEKGGRSKTGDVM